MGLMQKLSYIARHGFEGYVDMKIAERAWPHLKRRSEENQQWDRIGLQMSESEVGNLLGLPNEILVQKEERQRYSWMKAMKEDARWDVKWMYGWDGVQRFVQFKNHKVVGFSYLDKNNPYGIDVGLALEMDKELRRPPTSQT